MTDLFAWISLTALSRTYFIDYRAYTYAICFSVTKRCSVISVIYITALIDTIAALFAELIQRQPRIGLIDTVMADTVSPTDCDNH